MKNLLKVCGVLAVLFLNTTLLLAQQVEVGKANYYSDDSIGYENCYRDINTLLKESFDLLPQFFTEYPQALKFIIEKPKVLFVEKDLLLNFKDIKNDSAVFILNIANIRTVPRHQLRKIVYGEFFGFFMQKWVEAKIPEMPTFLKILDFEGFLEGWQLYMQRCAYENGNFKNDYEKLAYVQYELFLSAIIVVDTGIHAKKWTREAALVYLKDVTGLPDDFLREAVDKCIVLPAKSVVAKLGQTRITALKSYAQKKMGKNFDSKLFNTFVIKNGQMPLTVLNKEVIWEVIHKNDAKASIFK